MTQAIGRINEYSTDELVKLYVQVYEAYENALNPLAGVLWMLLLDIATIGVAKSPEFRELAQIAERAWRYPQSR